MSGDFYTAKRAWSRKGKHDVDVKTWSLNETRLFREWLRTLKGKKIRILSVTSKGDVLTKVEYEVLEQNRRLVDRGEKHD